MADGYKGESPGKKHARAFTWLAIGHALGRERFVASRHMILASREGGDVGVLVAMGLDPSRIVAVDRDPLACESFARKFPRVPVVCDEAFRAVKRFKGRFASMFLDYCGEVTEARCRDALWTARYGLQDAGLIALNFQRGRERPLDPVRAYALNYAREARAEESRGSGPHPFDVSRQAAAIQAMNEVGASPGTLIVPVVYLNYHSRTAADAGVPMATAICTTTTCAPNTPAPRFWRKVLDARRKQPLLIKDHGYLTERELRRAMAFGELMPILGPEWSIDYRRLFGVAPGTMAAWRAHASRGTYRAGVGLAVARG